MKDLFNIKVLAIVGIIVIAALSRLLPHPENFNPIMALALFAGAYLKDKRLAFGIPLLAMLLSDMFIGFHTLIWAVYLSFGIAVMLGIYIKNRLGVGNVALATFAGSVIFFVITNFAYWLLYFPTLNFETLVVCYTQALPFFRTAIIGNFVYATIIFGGFALAQKYVPGLATANKH